MKIRLGVCLALLASLTLLPTSALAGRFHEGHAGGHPFVSHRFASRPFVHRFFFRPFIPFGVIVPPLGVYSPPPLVYAPPTYYNSSAYYDPPAGVAISLVPAPPPPTPTVVEYPTGRYELRGDGVTTPYTWVWIPNPPPPPPSAAAPAEAPASRDLSPVRHSYRWTDEQGVAHWTDRWDTVPEQYRQGAKQTQPF